MKLTPLFLALLTSLAFAQQGFPQTLTITDDGTTIFSAPDSAFTSVGNGDYTLEGASAFSVAPPIPSNISSYFDASGGGWYQGSPDGSVWIAASGLQLSDPLVSYSVAFQNTTGIQQTYTFSTSVPFTTTLFNPSAVRSSFTGALVDGTPGQTGVTATPTQTGSLDPVVDAPVTATILSPGTIGTAPTGFTTFAVDTPGYPLYEAGPSGTFDNLGVGVSVTLDPGAFIAFSGRVDVSPSDEVDVIPEPSSIALIALGAGSLFLVMRRRFMF